MSEIRRLQTFMDLARLGTIAAVSASSAYSTSAVSQQISRLEADFGVSLVEPSGRKLRLTSAGRLLADLAPGLVAAWETAQSTVAASEAQIRGTVRVAGFQTACLAIVPAMLPALRQLAPLLDVRCVQAEPDRSVAGLLAREYDVAIIERYAGHPVVTHAELEETVLGHDLMYIAVPHDFPGRGVEDLADVSWAFEPAGSPVHAWSLGVCRAAGFEPRVTYETPDVIVQCALAAAGQAAAFVPGLTPPHLRGSASLIPLPGSQARTLSVATRRSVATDPGVRAVIAAIRGVAARALAGESGPDRQLGD